VPERRARGFGAVGRVTGIGRRCHAEKKGNQLPKPGNREPFLARALCPTLGKRSDEGGIQGTDRSDERGLGVHVGNQSGMCGNSARKIKA